MPKRSLSDLVLDTIDTISARKNRPNLLRIYRHLNRLYDLSLSTCESLIQSLLIEGKVIRVTYKGNISYRNALKWKKYSYYMKKNMGSELPGSLLTSAISELIVQEPDYLNLGVPCNILEEHLLSMKDDNINKETIQKLLQRELKLESLLLENGNYFLGPKPVETPLFENSDIDMKLEKMNKTKNSKLSIMDSVDDVNFRESNSCLKVIKEPSENAKITICDIEGNIISMSEDFISSGNITSRNGNKFISVATETHQGVEHISGTIKHIKSHVLSCSNSFGAINDCLEKSIKNEVSDRQSSYELNINKSSPKPENFACLSKTFEVDNNKIKTTSYNCMKSSIELEEFSCPSKPLEVEVITTSENNNRSSMGSEDLSSSSKVVKVDNTLNSEPKYTNNVSIQSDFFSSPSKTSDVENGAINTVHNDTRKSYEESEDLSSSSKILEVEIETTTNQNSKSCDESEDVLCPAKSPGVETSKSCNIIKGSEESEYVCSSTAVEVENDASKTIAKAIEMDMEQNSHDDTNEVIDEGAKSISDVNKIIGVSNEENAIDEKEVVSGQVSGGSSPAKVKPSNSGTKCSKISEDEESEDKDITKTLTTERVRRQKKTKYDASEYYFPSLKRKSRDAFIDGDDKKDNKSKKKKKKKENGPTNLSGVFAKRVMFPGNTSMCSECKCYVSKVKLLDSMVLCRTCSNQGHHSCAAKTMEGKTWHCSDCRQDGDVCKICKKMSHEKDRGVLHVCNYCGENYHRGCHNPVIKLPFSTTWHCFSCPPVKDSSDLKDNTEPIDKNKVKTDSTEFKKSNKSKDSDSTEVKKTKKNKLKDSKSEKNVPFFKDEPPDPSSWSNHDVYEYFKKYFSEDIAKVILDQEIDGYSLRLLDRADILKLDFDLGTCLKLLIHIKRLQLRTNNLVKIWND